MSWDHARQRRPEMLGNSRLALNGTGLVEMARGGGVINGYDETMVRHGLVDPFRIFRCQFALLRLKYCLPLSGTRSERCTSGLCWRSESGVKQHRTHQQQDR